jgi:hypothetical protein
MSASGETMNAVEAHPAPARIGFLRQGLTIYFRGSLITFIFVLLVLTLGPGGITHDLRTLALLPLLYLLFWSGPFYVLLIFASGPNAGMESLFCGCILLGSGIFALLAFLVRPGVGRTVLLSLSAMIWFGAAFAIFLGESI